MKDLAIYTSSKLLPSLLNFVAMALLSRMLGPTEYGQLALLTASASFLSTLVLQWPNQYLFRFFSNEQNNKTAFISNLIKHQVNTGLICLILAGIIGYYFSKALWWIGLVLLGTTQAFFEFSLRLHNLEFQRVKFLKQNILRSCAYLVCTPAILLVFGSHYALVVGANTLIYLLSSLTSINKKYLNLSRKTETIPGAINYIFPLMLASGLTIVLDAIDRYFINFYHGAAVTGIYSANYEILQYSLQSIFGIILLICGPLVFDSYEKKDFSALNVHLIRIQKFFFALMFPLAIFMNIFSSEIVALTSGRAYLTGNNSIVSMLILGIFLSGIKMYFFDQILLMTKNTRQILIINAIGLSLNVVLNYLLIPKLEILGAATATAASFFGTFALSAVISRKYYKWPLEIRENCIYIVLFSALGAGTLLYTKTAHLWIFAALIYLVLWSAILYFMNWENIKFELKKLKR